MMQSPAHPAPLASWCIALAMVLALLAVFLHWISTPGVVGDMPLLGQFRAEVEDFLSVPPGQRKRPRGVMLASSGAMCAASGARQLSSEGPDLLVLPFPFATFDDFDPIVERLATLQPDFIIIQSSVLVDSTPLNFQYVFFIDSLNFWIRKNILGKTPKSDPHMGSNAICSDERRPAEVWQEMEAAIYSKPKEQLSRTARIRIFAGLEMLDRAGIPIMVVGVPRYEDTVKYGNSVMTKARQLIKNAPHPIERVTFHMMTELFPAERFFDPLHVMSSLRPNYRTWLQTEIRKAQHPP